MLVCVKWYLIEVLVCILQFSDCQFWSWSASILKAKFPYNKSPFRYRYMHTYLYLYKYPTSCVSLENLFPLRGTTGTKRVWGVFSFRSRGCKKFPNVVMFLFLTLYFLMYVRQNIVMFLFYRLKEQKAIHF